MAAFNERFVVNNPAFAAIAATINTLVDETPLAQSTELVTMAQVIRRYSILLRSVQLSEIYKVITQDTDPEISLILLSSRNADGTFRFVESVVRSMMWGNPVLTEIGFTDGIREVSCRLAASILIGAYATQPFQLDTAEFLRKTALANLDKIVELQAVTATAAAITAGKDDDKARFYFQPIDFTTTNTLRVQFLIPSFTTAATWIQAVQYAPGTSLNSRRIVADLANAINTYTLNPANSANIIAAPNQAGEQTLHYIDFGTRSTIVGFLGEVVTVRIDFVEDPNQLLPFSWGTINTDLKPYYINSQLLLLKSVKEGTLTSVQPTASTPDAIKANRTVLYIRPKNPTVPVSTSDISFRLSATEDSIKTASLVPSTDPRYSQAALALVNSIQAVKSTNKLLGAIVRNDLPSFATSMAAVELVAWTATNPETRLVMDVLDIPNDLEIALGDELAPQTSFTDQPLTVLINPNYQRLSVATTPAVNNSANNGAALVGLGTDRNSLALNTKELSRYITGHQYG